MSPDQRASNVQADTGARVVAVEIGEKWKAYPFSDLAQAQVVNDEVGGEEIVVFWKGGTASALDSRSFDDAKDVGSTGIFSRIVDGQTLTFRAVDEGFEDIETGTTWNLLGEASKGPLKGAYLEQIVSAEHFWFAWAAFRPETVIWSP